MLKGSSPLALRLPPPHFSPMPTPFRTTLWRVMLMQLVALTLLWLLQSRYHLRIG